MDYTRRSIVLEKGDFAVRGNIIDIFPTKENNPIRIEYDLNTIERIEEFSIETQLKLKSLTDITIYQSSTDIQKIYNENAIKFNDKVISNIFEGDYVIHEDYGWEFLKV